MLTSLDDASSLRSLHLPLAGCRGWDSTADTAAAVLQRKPQGNFVFRCTAFSRTSKPHRCIEVKLHPAPMQSSPQCT